MARSIENIFTSLSSINDSLTKVIDQAKKMSADSSVFDGEIARVLGEQLNNYFIPTITKLRDVEIEDLLGRPAVDLEIESVMGYVKDKVVLVTGGGGSIGSELCRQIAGYKPKKLIIVDIYENNAYEIQQELKHKYPYLDLVVLIASVRNTNRMNSIFETSHA